MRRFAALPLLTALFALTLPASPASACSVPVPELDVGSTVVAAGDSVTVAGDAYSGPDSGCDTPTPPLPTSSETPSGEPSGTPSEEPSEAPSETPSGEPSETLSAEPSETMSVTAPPLAMVKVAYDMPPPPPRPVTIEIVQASDYWSETGPGRVIGTATATTAPVPGADATHHEFASRVTIPADLAPARYRISAADHQVFYGYAIITVVPSLPETGAASDDLLRLGALLVLAGAGALVMEGRRRHHGLHQR